METVNGFSYLGDKLNSSGDGEVAVTARVRIGLDKIQEMGRVIA